MKRPIFVSIVALLVTFGLIGCSSPVTTPVPVPSQTHTPTATSVAASPTVFASPTPVLAIGTTTTPPAIATVGPELATATALHATLTANAVLYAATLTARVGQPTSVPDTGFADDVGLPTMLGLAVLLIAVIFLVRRVRTA